MLKFVGLVCWVLTVSAWAGRPGVMVADELRGFEELEPARRKLLEVAIEVAKEASGLPYKFGGNSPEGGGFDCSGAMVYVMEKAELKPPRTSSGQFLWVARNSVMKLVPASARDLKDPSFAELKPGDLLFWSGTYEPLDGREIRITHVAMFLGYEKRDGHPVIINASDGRSYRRKPASGYGVFDFVVPREGGRSRLVGYGTPPGLMVEKSPKG